MPANPTTHDLTPRCRGRDYTFEPIGGGTRGRVVGWHEGIGEGDYPILRDGPGTTRYRVESARHFGDPRDMLAADAASDPRPG